MAQEQRRLSAAFLRACATASCVSFLDVCPRQRAGASWPRGILGKRLTQKRGPLPTPAYAITPYITLPETQPSKCMCTCVCACVLRRSVRVGPGRWELSKRRNAETERNRWSESANGGNVRECEGETESGCDNIPPDPLVPAGFSFVCPVQGQDVPCQISAQKPVSVTQGRPHLKCSIYIH